MLTGRSARLTVCRLWLVLASVSAAGCDNLGRTGEELDAIRIAKKDDLPDEDALAKVATACMGEHATVKVATADGGPSLEVYTSVSGWNDSSLEAFKAGVRRRLGRQALCVLVAGERRKLASVRIIHLLAETKTVLYDVVVTPQMLDAKVTDWRKARFGGGDEERDVLHDQVADAFEVREQHIDELTAFRVDAPK